ncbi:MAG: CrcB family protein [Calditrichaeota bacterium]|nr:CrcB family protein [Candidatus Cloacimonadota bacterium]MCB1048344.1 CrcB family protein [Calditrichota bacterium]MCB9472614.1 CrcB family protein [Candidatus Delongbacteria bacterium]
MKLLLLGLSGAAGTLCRYGLARAGQHWFASFAIGTLLANLLGCLLFGLIWELSQEHGLLPLEYRLVLLTGFMGAFTTFSTWIFDSRTMLLEGQLLAGLGNLVGQSVAGLLLFGLGIWLARGLA